jgi:dihydrofolate synthase/folylpolyglutamate synthase
VQHYNAAAAIAGLMALRDRLHVPFRALRIGLAEASVRGRLEVFPGAVETIVDVGHNPQAAQVLADWLRRHPRRTRAVFSALADKDLAGIIEPLLPRVTHWHLCGLDAVSPRGLDVQRVHARVGELIGADHCSLHADPEAALASAHSASQQGERVLAFGSFLLVSALGPTLNRMSAPAN